MERIYDIKILFKNHEIKNTIISVNTLRHKNFEDVLKIIEATKTAKFKIYGKIVEVEKP
jgi:hypothetical protein